MLLVTSSPGGSLPLYFSRSSSKVLALRGAKTCFFASPCSLCVSLLVPCRWLPGSLCWWRLPSIQNFFHRNVCQKSKRWWQWAWKKGKFLFELQQLQRACSSYWQHIVVPQVRSIREKINTWTVGFWNFFYPTDPRNADRPTHERLRKKVRFHAERRVLVRLRFWEAGFRLLFGATFSSLAACVVSASESFSPLLSTWWLRWGGSKKKNEFNENEGQGLFVIMRQKRGSAILTLRLGLRIDNP